MSEMRARLMKTVWLVDNTFIYYIFLNSRQANARRIKGLSADISAPRPYFGIICGVAESWF
jgi:hypothetical protein